jgi:hypothetical protein
MQATAQIKCTQETPVQIRYKTNVWQSPPYSKVLDIDINASNGSYAVNVMV